MKYLPWAFAVVGSWLIAAPFLLGYSGTEIAKNNDIGVGALMIVGALIWGFSELRHRGSSVDMQAQHR
jgi:hypothetical protein